MKPFARLILSLFVILNFPTAPADLRAGGLARQQFEIMLPRGIHSEQVQIRYFLTGDFGGYGSSNREEPGRRAYGIPTMIDGRPAVSLKVAVFAPGCQIVTVSIPSLPESSGRADFTCKELPSLTFTGRVLSSEFLSGHQYEVEIDLLTFWGHAFFGISDGMVTTFRVASVIPNHDGFFTLQLPDFTRDAVTKSFGIGTAALQFIARERCTGNILGMLEPKEIRADVPGMLPLQADYGRDVIFGVRSIR